MKCPRCDTDLRIKNTYSSRSCKFQRAMCAGCETIYTLCTAILVEDPKYGQGAQKMHEAVARGEKVVRVSVESGI